MKALSAVTAIALFSFGFSASATARATFGALLSDGGNVQTGLSTGGGAVPSIA